VLKLAKNIDTCILKISLEITADTSSRYTGNILIIHKKLSEFIIFFTARPLIMKSYA